MSSLLPARAPYKFLDPTMPPHEPDSANTNLINYHLPPLPNLGVPPLPPISDPALEKQVFTHSSFIHKTRKATSLEEVGIEDNEKLEHVGDSIITISPSSSRRSNSTSLTPSTTTAMPSANPQILKGHLVSNLSLSQLSKHYGLPQRIQALAADVWNLSKGEKVQANLFEAYVAALYTSYLTPVPPSSHQQHIQSPISSARYPPLPSPESADIQGRAFARVGHWLKPLFTPLCHWLLEEIKIEQKRLEMVQSGAHEDSHVDSLAAGATARLNEHMMKFHKTTPEYPSCRAGSEKWLVSCTARDKEGRIYTAQATRPTKKQAGNIAAYKICLEMGL